MIDIAAIFSAIEGAQRAFDAVNDIADEIAAVLANTGQPELKDQLARLRLENDAARARRQSKLAEAAARGA